MQYTHVINFGNTYVFCIEIASLQNICYNLLLPLIELSTSCSYKQCKNNILYNRNMKKVDRPTLITEKYLLKLKRESLTKTTLSVQQSVL